MAGRVKEKPDQDMLQNLDLLLSMDVIEEEESWDVSEQDDQNKEGDSDDKT